MQATLMNFGDSTRVICDVMNRPVAIDIGQVVETDICDAHFHLIKRGVHSESLMIVPKDSRMSDKLQSIVDLMNAMATETYTDVMQRFTDIVPFDEDADNAMRPSRETMRIALRDLARLEVAKQLGLQSKVITETPPKRNDDHMLRELIPDAPEFKAVTIHEQGDEVTRQPVKTIKLPASESQDAKVIEPPKDKAPAKKAKSKNGRSKPKIKRERL